MLRNFVRSITTVRGRQPTPSLAPFQLSDTAGAAAKPIVMIMRQFRNLSRPVVLALAMLIGGCAGAAEGGTKDAESSQTWRPPSVPAFPGAEGYGSGSKGGRGGRIIQVTTLADSGRGSLRDCIEQIGPRVCVFRVAGVIRFTGKPPRIRNPFITIAGQSAPGGGITLAHSGGKDGLTPLVIKNTNDVIIRDIRIRNDRIGDERGSEDSITIQNSSHVIIDHVSASWARDELVNGDQDNDFITISNSIFSWGIPKHDKCALLASHPGSPQHLSFIGNLCAHNGDRNPDINFPPGSCVEIVNNVFYDAESEFAEVWETWGGSPVAIVGNSFIAGPSTGSNAVGIARQRIGSTGPARVFVEDNAFLGAFRLEDSDLTEVLLQKPDCPLTLKPQTAKSAYEQVLNNAGAFPRDALDWSAVQNVKERKGKIAKAPGTIPPIAAALAEPDTDKDGMPDAWEKQHGSNPEMPDAWDDAGGKGIANLDAWLDERHRQLMSAAQAQASGI